MPPFTHTRHFSASSSHNYHNQQPLYYQPPSFPPPSQNPLPPFQAPYPQANRDPRFNLPRVTPTRNFNRWGNPRSQSSDWHVQWTPTLPTPQLTTSPSPTRHSTVVSTPEHSTFDMPLTPEWFPTALPEPVPDFVLQPPASFKPYHEPSPSFDALFASNFIHMDKFHDRENPFVSHERRSPIVRGGLTPELPTELPMTHQAVHHHSISKKTMEAKLLQQPISTTPLCEILKEGQLCHLRRYERDGVCIRNTVKLDKAFKHLGGLRDNLQHLVIGIKAIPNMVTVDLVLDDAVISLFQSLPGLLEARLQGFTKLTKRSFDAALIHCPKLRVLAITGTRLPPGSEPRKLVYHHGRPAYAGGMGSLSADTLRSLIPNDGPVRDIMFMGRHLQFIDLSFQNVDFGLATQVTVLPGRFGQLVIMRELQTSTERYFRGALEVSPAIDDSKLQGNNRPINPVASTIGWPVA